MNEEQLISLLKQNNEQGYAYLYGNYKGAILTVIQQIIPNNEIANDVLQEVFISIFENIDKYDAEKGRLFTWMHRLARNAAINKTKSKVYKSEQKNDNLEKFVDNTSENFKSVVSIDGIGLNKFLMQLNDNIRVVIEQFYLQGYTHEDIAQNLNIPLGTVKTRIRNGLIDLRKKMDLK